MRLGRSVINCAHVKRSFLDGQRVIEVLRDINLSVKIGEMVCIMGPSGSGKTTLLNIIACLDKPTGGEVYIGDTATSQLGDDELSAIRRRKIGMIFQDFYLLPTLSALENVEVPMIFDGVSEAKRKYRAAELMALVGVLDLADYRPGELSNGDRQRVSIARALVNDPPIILADEPTGRIDTSNGRKIVRLLKSITETDRAVLMVTHDPDAASQGDRVLLLKEGVMHKEILKNEERKNL